MLGLHVNTWTNPARATVRATNPGCLKILNTAIDRSELLLWRAAVPNGLLVYRQVFDGNASQDVAYRCAMLLNGVAPIRDLVDVVETPWNEEHQDPTSLAAYAAMTNQAVALLEGQGLDTAIGHFSTGQPDLAGWSSYYAALVPSKRRKFLSLHEYSAPAMQDGQGWYCLRYRRVYDSLPANLRLPLLLGECGIDYGVIPGKSGGWQSNGGTPATTYAGQLLWYAGNLAVDGARGFIFANGTYGPTNFGSFDVAGVVEVEAVIKGESPMLTIGAGLQKAANLIGPFIEDEVYDLPGTNAEVSRTATPKGWASWTKATNETTVYCVDGRIYADGGDRGDGSLKVIRGPFLA